MPHSKKPEADIQEAEMAYYSAVSSAELQRTVWQLEEERKEVNRKLNAIYAVLAARDVKAAERRKILEETGQLPPDEQKKKK